MNKKSVIFFAVLIGAFVIFNGLKNLSQDVSLKGWLSQYEGYSEAMAQHQQTKKPIVVLFYTDWCGSCKVLKAEILSSPDVTEFMKNKVLAVKINPERDMNSANLAKQFDVIGYPMLFVVRKGGEDIQWIRKTSRITTEQFIAQIQKAI